MNQNDLPTIQGLNYGVTAGAIDWNNLGIGLQIGGQNLKIEGAALGGQWGAIDQRAEFQRRPQDFSARAVQQQPEENIPTNMPKRIVRVYLADTDDNLPIEKCLLYIGEEKLTDLTDQELYFEVPIQDLLKSHNSYRLTVVDKKTTQKIGKEVFLEPVKIRDLKMTVVCVATF